MTLQVSQQLKHLLCRHDDSSGSTAETSRLLYEAFAGIHIRSLDFLRCYYSDCSCISLSVLDSSEKCQNLYFGRERDQSECEHFDHNPRRLAENFTENNFRKISADDVHDFLFRGPIRFLPRKAL